MKRLVRWVASPVLAAMVVVMLCGSAWAQSNQFPQLPLKRDAAVQPESIDTFTWSGLMVLGLAGVALVVFRKRLPKLRTASMQELRSSQRTALTQQCSVHVVEWNGEELLVGCSQNSVSLLARRHARPMPISDRP